MFSGDSNTPVSDERNRLVPQSITCSYPHRSTMITCM